MLFFYDERVNSLSSIVCKSKYCQDAGYVLPLRACGYFFILNPELEVVNFSYICNFLGGGPVHVIYVGTR